MYRGSEKSDLNRISHTFDTICCKVSRSVCFVSVEDWESYIQNLYVGKCGKFPLETNLKKYIEHVRQ